MTSGRGVNQFWRNRRPYTESIQGKIYFSTQGSTPTVSGITTSSVGFRGLSSVSRTALGKYRLTFENAYMDLVHHSFGNLGNVTSGVSPVVADESKLSTDKTLDVWVYNAGGTLIDPVNCGISFEFQMKRNWRG